MVGRPPALVGALQGDSVGEGGEGGPLVFLWWGGPHAQQQQQPAEEEGGSETGYSGDEDTRRSVPAFVVEQAGVEAAQGAPAGRMALQLPPPPSTPTRRQTALLLAPDGRWSRRVVASQQQGRKRRKRGDNGRDSCRDRGEVPLLRETIRTLQQHLVGEHTRRTQEEEARASLEVEVL